MIALMAERTYYAMKPAIPVVSRIRPEWQNPGLMELTTMVGPARSARVNALRTLTAAIKDTKISIGAEQSEVGPRRTL
jgi:hypothetical protein